MKYQVIKHLKSGAKTVAIVPTMGDAKTFLRENVGKGLNAGITFDGFSYMGGFPIYSTTPFSTPKKNERYSIQGLADIGVVCSLDKEALANARV